MRRKLWPKAPATEGALGQVSKNFQVFFQETKQKQFTIEPKSYTAMLLYLFFYSLLSTCPIKIGTKKWPKAAPLYIKVIRMQLHSFAFGYFLYNDTYTVYFCKRTISFHKILCILSMRVPHFIILSVYVAAHPTTDAWFWQ